MKITQKSISSYQVKSIQKEDVECIDVFREHLIQKTQASKSTIPTSILKIVPYDTIDQSRLVIHDDGKILVHAHGGPSRIASKILAKFNKMLKEAKKQETDTLMIKLAKINVHAKHTRKHSTAQDMVYHVRRESCPDNYSYVLNKDKPNEKKIHPTFRIVAHRVNSNLSTSKKN